MDRTRNSSPGKRALGRRGYGVPLQVLAALGLLYLFLLSIGLMGASFKMFGAGFATRLIRNCSNPVVGLFIGLLATSLIQSSSTTTSLVVGFVGGGVLPLEFAIPIIMGANIGTSVTNTIVSFGFVTRREDFRRAFAGATVHDFFNLCSVAVLFPIEIRFHVIERLAGNLTAAFGAAGGVKISSPLKIVTRPVIEFMERFLCETLALRDTLAASILLAATVVVLILSLIYLVRTLRLLVVNRAERFMNEFLFRNDFTALSLGLVLTALVQSSSVTTSLIVPLIGAGVVTIRRCYPYTLGANVGTTCTALLAALATVEAGKGGCVGVTAAFAHLVFNLLGIAIFYPLKRLPIFMATRLGALAARSRRWAVIFVLTVFFGVPLLMILVTR